MRRDRGYQQGKAHVSRFQSFKGFKVLEQRGRLGKLNLEP